MVQKVLTSRSFIGGRLREAGEVVDFDDVNPTLAVPAASSSLAQLSPEEIEAYLRRLKGADKDPATSTNLAEPTEQNTGRTIVPLADITVRSNESGRPQGAPAGSTEVNGQFVRPAPEGASSPVETYVGTPGAASAFDHDGDGKPGGSLSREDMKAALDDRGVEYPKNATDDKLRSLLAEPPKA